jgi:hypothetical protein
MARRRIRRGAVLYLFSICANDHEMGDRHRLDYEGQRPPQPDWKSVVRVGITVAAMGVILGFLVFVAWTWVALIRA